MPPGTLWRRAIKRVDRRARIFNAMRPLAYAPGQHVNHCAECARQYQLLGEAVRLSNALYASTREAG